MILIDSNLIQFDRMNIYLIQRNCFLCEVKSDVFV